MKDVGIHKHRYSHQPGLAVKVSHYVFKCVIDVTLTDVVKVSGVNIHPRFGT